MGLLPQKHRYGWRDRYFQSWGAFIYSSSIRRQSTNIIAQKPWDQQWTQQIETLSLKVAGEKSPLCCCTGWCSSGCWHGCSVQSGRQRDPSLQDAKPAWGRCATCRCWRHPCVLQNGLVYILWSWFADKGNEKKLRLQQLSCVPWAHSQRLSKGNTLTIKGKCLAYDINMFIAATIV